jgi:hypothetical protein
MQLIGVPPVPLVLVLVLVELDVLAPVPEGQLTSLFAQSSGDVKKHPTAPNTNPAAIKPRPEPIDNARRMRRLLISCVARITKPLRG